MSVLRPDFWWGIVDRLRASLFALPAAAVVVAFLAARLLVGVDTGDWLGTSTVESARTVLSTIAAATITFASVAFSVSLLVIQQGTNQYSPRVLHGLVRDPFNRRVIAVVMATFTFCLVTLQQVRAEQVEDGEAVVPQLSVGLAVALGLIAVLSIVGVIDHTARTIDVSVILDRIVDEASRADPQLPSAGLEPAPSELTPVPATAVPLLLHQRGWVCSVDLGALTAAVPPATTLRLETGPGRYGIEGMIVAWVWPPVSAPDELTDRVNTAIDAGPTRTMRHDPAFAVRQLVDVALRALSPGVNDPTTAHDAMMHLGTVLMDRLTSERAPVVYTAADGRRIELAFAVDDEELLGIAFDELRAAAATEATVSIYVVELLHTMTEALTQHGRTEAVPLLRRHADRMLASAEERQPDPIDRQRVGDAHRRRFGR